MFSLTRTAHCGRVHSGDGAAGGFSTSHRDLSWRLHRLRVPRWGLGVSQVGRDGQLAELLGQRDDDPLGAADIAEPVAVLVLRYLSDEFRAVGSQAGDSGVDVVDGEHDAP